MESLRNLSKNVAVLTTTYIIEDKMPVLYVCCDEDEEGEISWQFHCGNNDFDMKKVLLVGLSTVLNVDAELININLEVGGELRRDTALSEWKKV
ncbi:MAG: hypothetical protein QNK23_14295 [Crocinitomicaceae bacterium]|nr:hypothetical protein [Crocinitomicaceae bacterium]